MFCHSGTDRLQYARGASSDWQTGLLSTLGWHWGFPQDLFALNHYNPESIYIFFEAFGSLFPLE